MDDRQAAACEYTFVDLPLESINWLNALIMVAQGLAFRALAYIALQLCNRDKMGKASWLQLFLMYTVNPIDDAIHKVTLRCRAACRSWWLMVE